VAHWPRVASSNNGNISGGLWKYCNNLGCEFIKNQQYIDEKIWNYQSDEDYETKFLDYYTYYMNGTLEDDYLPKYPADYTLLKVGRFGILTSHLFALGVILSLGLRIALIFTELVAFAMLVAQACCHYICLMIGTMSLSIAMSGLFEKTEWVMYVLLVAFALTHVAIFVTFGYFLHQHLEKNNVIEKKD